LKLVFYLYEYYMNYKIYLHKHLTALTLVLFFSISYSQDSPKIKYLDEETIDEMKIDYDRDGDMDLIIAGVFVEKNQGRVYIIENNGQKYDKPEFIYSFPSIGMKQDIEILQDGNLTTIITIGTSPTGKQDKFIATLYKGEFEGMIVPPVSSDSTN